MTATQEVHSKLSSQKRGNWTGKGRYHWHLSWAAGEDGHAAAAAAAAAATSSGLGGSSAAAAAAAAAASQGRQLTFRFPLLLSA